MKIFILLEKTLSTEQVRVKGVYDTLELANSCMEDFMNMHVEACSYKIEEKELNDDV